MPDLAIALPPLRRYLDHHPHPEEIFWLVEYADATLATDLGMKRWVYAAAGIREYWVCDLKHKRLVVFRDRAQEVYGTERALTEGTMSPLAFPEIAVEVNRLLR